MRTTLRRVIRNHKRYKMSHKTDNSSSEMESIQKELIALHETVQSKDQTIIELENKNLQLEESLADLEIGIESKINNGKSYSTAMRLHVFDAIVNHVPTNNIPKLLEKFFNRLGTPLDEVPHRTTVEMMIRELGVISELQTAEIIHANSNLTIGFDATTQEGVHINSIHVTTTSNCYVIAVDQLPGGTAQDYHQHICDSVDNLANTYSIFNNADFQNCRKQMINNISNSMSDRCAANHAALQLVNESWGKSLNELNCHLHPLDSMATCTKSALRKIEDARGKLFGKDCFAGNIVLQMNKMRYKDGKGDPKGFTTFLDDAKLPRGILPRYRGNRLHILFHLSGIYVEHHTTFMRYLRMGTSCGGLRTSILEDFNSDTAKTELQVLGLIGKLLTGPWMKTFYTSADSQIDHVDGIILVSKVIDTLKKHVENPLIVLSATHDFLGNTLGTMHDKTVAALQQMPIDEVLFSQMIKACLTSIIELLERQYKRYFSLDITEKLRDETKSARSHNIDAEEIMGMFSAAKSKAPNATLCYLSCKMRAQKNKTVEYLDDLEQDKRANTLTTDISMARKQRHNRRLKQKDLAVELSRRQANKLQERETLNRKKLEKRLRSIDLKNINVEFPDMEDGKCESVVDLLGGKAIGRKICHMWSDDNVRVMFNGKIEKLKKRGGGTYTVAYWSQQESYTNAVHYDISKYELAADLISDDLIM